MHRVFSAEVASLRGGHLHGLAALKSAAAAEFAAYASRAGGLCDCIDAVLGLFLLPATVRSQRERVTTILVDVLSQYEVDRAPPPEYVELTAVLDRSAREELAVVDIMNAPATIDAALQSLAKADRLLGRLRTDSRGALLPLASVERRLSLRRLTLSTAKEAAALLTKMRATPWLTFINANLEGGGLQQHERASLLQQVLGLNAETDLPERAGQLSPQRASPNSSFAGQRSLGWAALLTSAVATADDSEEPRLCRHIDNQIRSIATVFQHCLPVLDMLQQRLVVSVESVMFLPLPADCSADTPQQKVVTVTPTTKPEQVLLNPSSLRLWAALLLRRPPSGTQGAQLTPAEIYEETPHRLASRLKRVCPLPGAAASIEGITTFELFFSVIYPHLFEPWALTRHEASESASAAASAAAATGGLCSGVGSLNDFLTLEEALARVKALPGKMVTAEPVAPAAAAPATNKKE